MKTIANLSGILVLTILQSAHSADTNEASIQLLAEMMAGKFDTHSPSTSSDLPAEQRFVDWRQRVHAPSLGRFVFYLQLNKGADLDLYRQRILILEINEDTERIEQRAFSLHTPERFIDSLAMDDTFSELRVSDLTAIGATGCEQVWVASASNFIGHVDPKRCRIISGRTGKPRRIEARNVLTRNGLSLEERGFDDDLNQLFGTPPGESLQLFRVE